MIVEEVRAELEVEIVLCVCEAGEEGREEEGED